MLQTRFFVAAALLVCVLGRVCTSFETCIALFDYVSAILPEPWLSIFSSLHLDDIFLARSRAAWVGSNTATQWCPHNAAYEFIPATAATLPASQGFTTNWTATDGCFQSMTAEIMSMSQPWVRVRLNGTATKRSCNALYAIADSFGMELVELAAGTRNSVTVDVNVSTADLWTDVTVNGLAVFLLPCGTEGTLASVLATAELFISSQSATSAANAAMLAYRGVWPAPLEPFNKTVLIDPSIIPSGTYISIMEFTGTDAMQALGTGPSGTGHSAVVVWRGTRLFVCESTHNLKYYGNGIMATEWSIWWEKNAAMGDRMASLLVLADNYREVFNEDAFWAWFDTVKGTPYGFNNYLFSGACSLRSW